MSESIKNIAVILASGTGLRFASKLPKQFIRLAGKPVVQYAIEAFERCDDIDEIIVVTRPEYIDYVYDIVNAALFRKINKVIGGGKERYDSTLAALKAIPEGEYNIIIHDAVRPFVSDRIIRDSIQLLNKFNAVDVVVDAVDTIVRVQDGEVKDIPDRRFLKRGQTPQSFKKSILLRAYELFMNDSERITSDDCGIVLKYLPDERVATVEGEEGNFKITHPQDIYLADNLIRDGLMARLTQAADDIQATFKNKVVVVIGASSGIGKDIVDLCLQQGATVEAFSRRLNGVDIAKLEHVQHALKETHQKHGRIDFVINTAGLLNKKPIMSMSEEEIFDGYTVNYVGVINITRASFKYLKETRGMLINFTSSSHTRGRPNYSLYSSAKAAVVNFTQAVSEEWLSHGVRVNAINPERTATPMRTANFGVEPQNSLLSSREVAEFTLSAMSFEYTGQVFSIKNDV